MVLGNRNSTPFVTEALDELEAGGARRVLVVPTSAWRTVAMTADRVAVVPARGAAWPAYDFDPEAWRITFRAGYGDAGEAVPSPIRSAITSE